jgi:DNA-dependent RNA polymerase auxiliary subunit epsilon
VNLIERVKGEQNMIFKVLYQENRAEVPVRENTQSLYVEASSEREVRDHLKDRNYNIEFIQLLEGNHLQYEQDSPNFELESLE